MTFAEIEDIAASNVSAALDADPEEFPRAFVSYMNNACDTVRGYGGTVHDVDDVQRAFMVAYVSR